MKINQTLVRDNLEQLQNQINPETFVYDFLACFDTAQSIIDKLKLK